MHIIVGFIEERKMDDDFRATLHANIPLGVTCVTNRMIDVARVVSEGIEALRYSITI
jgi:hypothetical protein